MPLEAHIKEHAAYFKRFNAVWTPTVIVMDPDGHEVWRLEGYLPKDEFEAQLRMAFARVAVMQKRWDDAQKSFAEVVDKYPNTSSGAEALYWRDVSVYNKTHDHIPLQNVAKELRQRYPDSVWTKKASVWAA